MKTEKYNWIWNKLSKTLHKDFQYSPQHHDSSLVLLRAESNYLIAANTQIGLEMPV